MNNVQYLHLEKIKTDPKIMRLLPPEIARQYHVLPIAKDGNRITIAMAHPEDMDVCQIIDSTLGKITWKVQADTNEIDRVIDEIWPQNTESRLKCLLWTPVREKSEEIQTYSQALAGLFHADLVQVELPWPGFKNINDFINKAETYHPELIILQIPSPPPFKQLWVDFVVNNLIERLSTSILIVRQPKWPINEILFFIRDNEDINDTSVNWVIRFGRDSHAKVTVLPFLPQIPEMYGSMIQHSLQSLFSSSDPFGEKLRWIANRLKGEQVDGAFKIRSGSPIEQLRCEVLDSNTDLVVIATETHSHLWRWFCGEIVNNLFIWFDRPLLITKHPIK